MQLLLLDTEISHGNNIAKYVSISAMEFISSNEINPNDYCRVNFSERGDLPDLDQIHINAIVMTSDQINSFLSQNGEGVAEWLYTNIYPNSGTVITI